MASVIGCVGVSDIGFHEVPRRRRPRIIACRRSSIVVARMLERSSMDPALNPPLGHVGRVLLCAAIALVMNAVPVRDSAAAAARWQPEKPIELSVGAGPGTPTDITIRTI